MTRAPSAADPGLLCRQRCVVDLQRDRRVDSGGDTAAGAAERAAATVAGGKAGAHRATRGVRFHGAAGIADLDRAAARLGDQVAVDACRTDPSPRGVQASIAAYICGADGAAAGVCIDVTFDVSDLEDVAEVSVQGAPGGYPGVAGTDPLPGASSYSG